MLGILFIKKRRRRKKKEKKKERERETAIKKREGGLCDTKVLQWHEFYGTISDK